MDRVEVTSTSRATADVSDIVIRPGDRTRLLFRPVLVENADQPNACVRGRFVYQRKKSKDTWEDYPRRPINQLGLDEEYQLELHAGELLALLHELGALYRFGRRQGIPSGKVELVRLEQRLAAFLRITDSEVFALLDAHPADAFDAVRRVLVWLARSPNLTGLLAADPSRLPSLGAFVGIAAMREAVEYWEEHADEAHESFWQSALEERAFLLSQILAYPVVVIRDRAYVGGKRVDNHHGGVVDFLLRTHSTGNAVLLEIKTPSTRLLAQEYRDDVFPPSHDLSGAISQTLSYRRRLLSNPLILQDEPEMLAGLVEPRAVVVIGNTAELDSPAKKESFELVRQRLSGVTIVTFDELFQRATDILALLEGASER